MKNNRFRKSMYILAFSFCVIVFVFSAGRVLYNMYADYQEQQLLNKIQAEKEQETHNPQLIVLDENKDLSDENDNLYNEDEQEDDKPKQILDEYKALYEENSDLYGWIEIEGTTINYPVMYTPDEPNFYIDKNWNKEVCPNGIGTSVYMSGEATPDSENIIIYGHHMKNSKLFGALGAYKDKEYYEEHKYIQFDTLYEKQTYEIICVSKGVVYYNESQIPKGAYLFYEHLELDTAEEFDEYVSNMKNNAWYEIETTAEFGDQLITLCTCDYWTKNARLVIVAKKI